jgi:hypothetical protein
LVGIYLVGFGWLLFCLVGWIWLVAAEWKRRVKVKWKRSKTKREEVVRRCRFNILKLGLVEITVRLRRLDFLTMR